MSRKLPCILVLSCMMLAAFGAKASAQTPATAPAAATQPAERDHSAATFSDAMKDPALFEDWVAATKKPVPWFTWGADARLREEYHVNNTTLNKHVPGREFNFQRYRERVWGTFTVLDTPQMGTIDINTRLTYEPRHFSKPDVNAAGAPAPEWRFNEAMFDTLNVTWSKLGGLPLKIVAGRQDLAYGNNWLIADGTPLDGSRTSYFDAFRGVYEMKDIQTTVDVVWVENRAESDKYIEPFCDKEEPVTDSDENGLIVYVTNKTLKKTQIDGYFIYKHYMPTRDLPIGGFTQDGEVYAFGGRVVHEFDEHWRARAEFVEELGHKNMEDFAAFGFNSQMDYFLKDKINNNFRVGYEFLSGDDPHTAKNEQFDALWGRYAQFSEILATAFALETRPGEASNMHRLGMGWSFNPVKPMEVCLDYHLLFCDENNRPRAAGFSDNGGFRGQVVTALLKYKFNEHVSTHLLGEAFFPGDYYTDLRNDVALYGRYEIVFSW